MNSTFLGHEGEEKWRRGAGIDCLLWDTHKTSNNDEAFQKMSPCDLSCFSWYFLVLGKNIMHPLISSSHIRYWFLLNLADGCNFSLLPAVWWGKYQITLLQYYQKDNSSCNLRTVCASLFLLSSFRLFCRICWCAWCVSTLCTTSWSVCASDCSGTNVFCVHIKLWE